MQAFFDVLSKLLDLIFGLVRKTDFESEAEELKKVEEIHARELKDGRPSEEFWKGRG